MNRDSDDQRVRSWVAGAPHPVTWLEGGRALEVDDPVMRAVSEHSGGLLIDQGWLRVLGGGHATLRALGDWNRHDGAPRFDRGQLIADDVLAGFFARFHASGTVHYLAPDSMEWEDLGVDYANWLETVLSDRLIGFYEDLRFPGWADEIAHVGPNEAFHIYPPLWAEVDEARTFAPVGIHELWLHQIQLAEQLQDIPDGGEVEIHIDD